MTRLEQLRRQRSISYNELSKLTNHVATAQSLHYVATGRTKRPIYETRRALEAVFGEPIDALLAEATA